MQYIGVFGRLSICMFNEGGMILGTGLFERVLVRMCRDVRESLRVNEVGLWYDVQGELESRDILIYGLTEYMGYNIRDMELWFGVGVEEIGVRDVDFRFGLKGGSGEYWDMARDCIGKWDRAYGRIEDRLF